MSVLSTAEILIDSKSPRDAVSLWVKTLRESAARLNGIEIEIWLFTRTYDDVLVKLAKSLPANLMGFQGKLDRFDQRKMTASEFLETPHVPNRSFSGKLTEESDAGEVLNVIEGLLDSSPRSIRSTMFHLRASRVRWKGAEDKDGGLNLTQNRGKKKFSLSASIRLGGISSHTPEVRTFFHAVANATQIPFDSGKIFECRDPDPANEPTAEELLIAQVCFDEACEDAANEWLGEIQWPPRIRGNTYSNHEAFQQRMTDWGDDRAERVDRAATAKRIFKSVLPEIQFVINNGDEIWFRKPLVDGIETVVALDKSLPQIGKAFTLRIGMKSTSGRIVWRWDTNLFQLYRNSDQRTWVYATQEEANRVITEAAELLQEVIPIWQKTILRWFQPWPTAWPKQLERRGCITAREAFTGAFQRAIQLYSDAQLIGLGASLRLQYGNKQPPESVGLTLDGRINESGEWGFLFHAPSKDAVLGVVVPSIGGTRIQDHSDRYRDINARWHLKPIGQDWIDSNQAIEIAEKLGGKERRETSDRSQIMLSIGRSRSGEPSWRVHYLVVDHRGRNDLTLELDALSGNPISDQL